MTILEVLQYEIPIEQCKNNKSVYVSKLCPFCNYQSKSNCFRYNTKLKVGKCFNCGVSFKEKYWLEKQLKDKLNTVKDNRFVKALINLEESEETDYSLPF